MNLKPFGDSTIGVASQWLHGLSRRQQAISENIANIDTPGYRSREVPFESELKRAVGRSATGLSTTDARHLTTGGRVRDQLSLQDAQQLTSSRLDENNVDIDQQMVQMAETQARYQAAASALSTKIATLRNVIRG